MMCHPVVFSRHLAVRTGLMLLAVYFMLLGGTFTGVLFYEVQFVSLALLTTGVVAWMPVFWRLPVTLRHVTILDGLPALWLAAYGLSAVIHPSGRSLIALWWVGLYAAIWWLAVDLLRRGLPGVWVVDAVMIAAVPVMLLALIQVSGWFRAWWALDAVAVAFVPPRPPGTLGNANALGTLLAMLLPFAVTRIWRPRHALERIAMTGWVTGAFVVLYLTFSRGAWGAALVGIAIWVTLAMPRNRWSVRNWWFQMSPGKRRFGVVAAAMILIALVSLALVTLHAFETPRRDASTRIVFWQIAWDTFRNDPLSGRGPATYGLSLLEWRSFPPYQPHGHAHNVVFTIAAELGVVGLFGLGVTAVVLGGQGWRRVRQAQGVARQRRAAFAAALIAAGVHSLVDNPLQVPVLMGFVVVIAAVLVVDPPAHRFAGVRSFRLDSMLYPVLALALWAVVLVTGWWSAWGYARYTRGEQAVVDGDMQGGMDSLGAVAAEWPELALYRAEYGYACGIAAASGGTACLPQGIAAYRRALALEPPHSVWWANLAAMYWMDGQDDQAVHAMERAVHFAPDAADFWLNLGVYYEALGREDDASVAYHRAMEADEDWAFIRFWQGTALRAAVRAGSAIPPSPFDRAMALWDAGDPGQAVAVLEATIARDPSQPKPYAQLARLHIAHGELQRAQVYLEAARVLAHTVQDDVWNLVVEADFARVSGDPVGYAVKMQAARDLWWPDGTGHQIPYGRDVAYLQFWRVRVDGALLPPLLVYNPDPELIDLLLAGTLP